MVTREWPPEIYGGAGVHVSNLVASIKKYSEIKVDVRCFGQSRQDATGYQVPQYLADLNGALKSILIDIDIATDLENTSLVHSHTWYANFSGYLASEIFNIPHVITSHSLEPLRPWKAEQLGGGYLLSSWIERLAYRKANGIIAVSDAVRNDILKAYPEISKEKVITIRNGIDTEVFKPIRNLNVLQKYEIPETYALFVGRITRQKGLVHLLRAWQKMEKDKVLVVAATSADEPQINQEVSHLLTELQGRGYKIIWIKEMLAQAELINILSSATVFLCPSIYEPLGIVNLEAMACETAVVASDVGGIPEVVVDGETGILVKYSNDESNFESHLAESISKVMSDRNLASKFGENGRERVVNEFGWDKVARKTIDFYGSF
jgi:starch synthase